MGVEDRSMINITELIPLRREQGGGKQIFETFFLYFQKSFLPLTPQIKYSFL